MISKRSHNVITKKFQRTHRHVKNVYPNTAHGFPCAHTLLSRPLECGHARILDLIQVLYTLSHINEQIRASGVGAETPDFARISDIP
jgi:hypothetical protein